MLLRFQGVLVVENLDACVICCINIVWMHISATFQFNLFSIQYDKIVNRPILINGRPVLI